MSTTRVNIDYDRCEGHAVCFLVAPSVFGVDDDGRGTVVTPTVGAEAEADARAAADRCPEQAIELSPVTP